jgi:phage terminase large subunit-like protein
VQQADAFRMLVKGNQAELRAHIAERTVYLCRCRGAAHAQRLAHGRVEQRTLRVAKAPPDFGRPHARQVPRLQRHIVAKRTGVMLSTETVSRTAHAHQTFAALSNVVIALTASGVAPR